MEAVSCKNLSFTYNGCKNATLQDISFTVKKGELVLVMGKSGCGKTTLLRLFKPENSPSGKVSGKIFIDDLPIYQNLHTPNVGFVMQNPNSQTISDNVYSELAFGLENLGLDSKLINQRIAETVSFFGVEKLLHREIFTLSGGEKQLVNLCAVMAMHPEILIFDEPVSRLDPVTAENFLSLIIRINRELGATVILAEHFCEGIFHECDKVMLLENGRQIDFDTPKNIVRKHENFVSYFPASAQIAKAYRYGNSYPLTVREGRAFLRDNFSPAEIKIEKKDVSSKTVLECKDLWFRYSKDSADILKSLDFILHEGEIFTVVGANGAGKSTLLKCICGLKTPYHGKIKAFDRSLKSYKGGRLYRNCMGVLPQNPYDIFVKSTVREDFEFAVKALGVDKNFWQEVVEELKISHLMDTHPYDLSGGEAQLCAIGRVLLSQPKILLLDEPVKGLDPDGAKMIGELLISLKNRGISVLCVSHSLEFSAEYSDRCGMFFDGRLVSVGKPQEFFSFNRFYTTAAQRISNEIFVNAVTVSQVCNEIRRQVSINGENG